MRIVSIPFDLIFACFQNKVLSCLIQLLSRLSFGLSLHQQNKASNLIKQRKEVFFSLCFCCCCCCLMLERNFKSAIQSKSKCVAC